MELLIALFIAVPVALAVTWAAMRLAARHNRAAARWVFNDNYNYPLVTTRNAH